MSSEEEWCVTLRSLLCRKFGEFYSAYRSHDRTYMSSQFSYTSATSTTFLLWSKGIFFVIVTTLSGVGYVVVRARVDVFLRLRECTVRKSEFLVRTSNRPTDARTWPPAAPLTSQFVLRPLGREQTVTSIPCFRVFDLMYFDLKSWISGISTT